MNSCEFYQELISSMVDGEISREEHEALMEHMKTCSACNAMYAVFHDLSDILAEEDEALPEGLHENIMAGVRRSEIMKKNRRMRRFGLSTALTAAACAVLVLFAAAGIGPGKRAESVSIRTEEEASQVMTSPAPEAVPVQSAPAAAPVQTWEPAATWAPADTAPASDGSMNTQYSVPQQNDPYNSYNTYNTYHEQPAPAYTPAPAVIQTTPIPERTVEPAPAFIAPPAQIEEPAVFWSEGVSAVYETPAVPVQTAAPAAYEAPAWTEPAANRTETAAEEPAGQESSGLMTLFSSMTSMFDSAEGDPAESKLDGQNAPELPAAAEAQPAPAAALPMEAEAVAGEELAQAEEMPDMDALDAGSGAAAQADDKTVQEERVRVYGKAQRARLLAMLGENEDALPEAELTRLVHVTFVPEDEYGSEEKMDIRIYGDFVFCERFPAESAGKSYRADCSLKELDSFLEACKLVSPTPAPTVDPYSVTREE